MLIAFCKILFLKNCRHANLTNSFVLYMFIILTLITSRVCANFYTNRFDTNIFRNNCTVMASSQIFFRVVFTAILRLSLWVQVQKCLHGNH